MSALTPLTRLITSPLFKFLLVGGSAFLVDLGLFWLAAFQLEIPILWARSLGFITALCITWGLNRRWTFAHRHQSQKRRQAPAVFVVALLAITVNLTAFSVVSTYLPQQAAYQMAALALGVMAGTAINWLGANYYAYRDNQQQTVTD